RRQSLDQIAAARIDMQTDDVDRLAAPSDRYSHAANELAAPAGCRRSGLGEAARIVVIREGEDPYAPRSRARDQLRGSEKAVRMRGMTVQIDADLRNTIMNQRHMNAFRG